MILDSIIYFIVWCIGLIASLTVLLIMFMMTPLFILCYACKTVLEYYDNKHKLK